jgi:Flp pilus assembly protein TadG
VNRVPRRDARAHTRGQGLVEFAMLIPVFMLLLLGMLEFGFIFDHTMTVTYATREGARSGAAFANGNDTSMVCTTSVDVDKHIVAAVQRVLQAPGSQVASSRVQNIKIYSANAAGTQVGTLVNTWTYSAGNGPSVDGRNLDFVTTAAATGWNACTRDNTWTNGVAPQSVGVSITYGYQFVTPLAAIYGFFGPAGSSTLPITDKTVMALNPLD